MTNAKAFKPRGFGRAAAAITTLMLAGMSVAPGLALAAGETTYSTNTTVTLTTPMNLTILAGSTASSVSVGTTTITVVAGTGNSLTIRAASSTINRLNNDAGMDPCFNPAAYSQLTITSGTVVITPALTGCSVSGTSNSGGGGGGGGSTTVTVPAAPTCSITAPTAGMSVTGGTATPITWTSTGSGINDVLLSYSVDGGVTYGLASSIGRANTGSYNWVVPNTGTTNAKVKVECRDSSGAVLATGVSASPFTIKLSTALLQTPAPVAPVVAPAPTVTAPSIVTLLQDPSKADTLANLMGKPRSTMEEGKWSALVKTDAASFKVALTAAQQASLANFVSYGISSETDKLGSGERRALVRDYLETVGRSDVSWEDMQRLTVGQKPVGRNLPKEQAKVTEVLAVFKKLTGHAPDFKNPKEDIAWNTLMYRIRFTRDLNKERAGISKFQAVYKRAPSSPLDWSAVRAWGYSLQ